LKDRLPATAAVMTTVVMPLMHARAAAGGKVAAQGLLDLRVGLLGAGEIAGLQVLLEGLEVGGKRRDLRRLRPGGGRSRRC
jgi:hypothetical protein